MYIVLIAAGSGLLCLCLGIVFGNWYAKQRAAKRNRRLLHSFTDDDHLSANVQSSPRRSSSRTALRLPEVGDDDYNK